jgi:hypothetical protein
MSARGRLPEIIAVLGVLAACAGGFALGRGAVDRTPPPLPPARTAALPAPSLPDAIDFPPRAVLP